MAFNQPTSGQNPNARKPRRSRQEPQQQPYDNQYPQDYQQPTGNEPYRQQPGWTFQQTPPAPFVEEPVYTTKENKSKPRVFLNQCKKTWNSWGKGKKAAAIVVALSLLGAAAGDKDESTQQEPPAPSPTVAAAHMTQTATPPMVTSTPEAVRAAATMPPLVYQTAAPVKPTATPRPTATPKPKSTKAPTATPKPTETIGFYYIINTKTKKFHTMFCESVDQMEAENMELFDGKREQLIKNGYESCKRCNP